VQRFGFIPEFYHIGFGSLLKNLTGYPLRPEFVESLFMISSVREDDYWFMMGETIIENINNKLRTKCGFASLNDVSDHSSIRDHMDSFFLSETLKYLYLLYDSTNFVKYKYIFNTEGHIFPISSKFSEYKFPSRADHRTYKSNLKCHDISYGLITMNMKDTLLLYKKKISVHIGTQYRAEILKERKKDIPHEEKTFDISKEESELMDLIKKQLFRLAGEGKLDSYNEKIVINLDGNVIMKLKLKSKSDGVTIIDLDEDIDELPMEDDFDPRRLPVLI